MSNLIPNVVSDLLNSNYQSVSEFMEEIQDPWNQVVFFSDLTEASMSAQEHTEWLKHLEEEYLV